jgi:DNA-binding XRE family transcriptional regulator
MQPKSESDPMESLVKSVNSAKGLMETLGQTLGVSKETSKDIEPALPSSRLDAGIEIAKKLAGSKEIQGLASSVTKAASAGFASIMQSREEAARQRNPSTEDILKKYEALERGKAPKVDTKSIEERNKVEDERRNVVGDVSPELSATEEESLLASLGLDPGQLKRSAEEMLDAVEDHSSMDDPIDEAAEDMIELLQKTFKQPREKIIDQVADASAKETLAELGHDESRLSAKALQYLDGMITHVRSLR